MELDEEELREFGLGEEAESEEQISLELRNDQKLAR